MYMMVVGKRQVIWYGMVPIGQTKELAHIAPMREKREMTSSPYICNQKVAIITLNLSRQILRCHPVVSFFPNRLLHIPL